MDNFPRQIFQLGLEVDRSDLNRINKITEDLARQKVEEKHNNSASGFFEKLMRQIQDEESQLQEDENLAVFYYNKGGQVIQINSIGFSNPHLIILCSLDTQGNAYRILTHMESVELTVMRFKRQPEEPKKEPFGFFIQE